MPYGRYEIGFGNCDADLRTARYAYALNVLELAHARTLDVYPDWLKHEWLPVEPGWRRVVFQSPQRRQAEDYCERLVHQIANGKEIAVAECLSTDLSHPRQRMLMIRDISEFSRQAVDAVVRGERAILTRTDIRFDYDEIADHVVRLDERMLSLLNAGDASPPLTQMDRELFDAAALLDLQRIEVALAGGANIHALDSGESVLVHVIQTSAWEHFAVDADICREVADAPEDRMAAVRYLLARGAGVNLFGFEGLAPLSAAVLRHDPRLVELLLSHGADPTSDQFPEEGVGEPTAPYYAAGDLHVVDDPNELADLREINALLQSALSRHSSGARDTSL